MARRPRGINISAQMQGADAILMQLNALPPRVKADRLMQAAKAGAEVIRAAVSANAPVGAGDRTVKGKSVGHLRDSIVAEGEAVDGYAVIYKVGPDKDHFYGAYVERGHAIVKRGPDGKQTIGHVPPKPFMRPALDESQEDAERAVAADLKRGLGL